MSIACIGFLLCAGLSTSATLDPSELSDRLQFTLVQTQMEPHYTEQFRSALEEAVEEFQSATVEQVRIDAINMEIDNLLITLPQGSFATPLLFNAQVDNFGKAIAFYLTAPVYPIHAFEEVMLQVELLAKHLGRLYSDYGVDAATSEKNMLRLTSSLEKHFRSSFRSEGKRALTAGELSALKGRMQQIVALHFSASNTSLPIHLILLQTRSSVQDEIVSAFRTESTDWEQSVIDSGNLSLDEISLEQYHILLDVMEKEQNMRTLLDQALVSITSELD